MSECPYCAQPLPPNLDKRALKHERQRRTMFAMRDNGIVIGRPKKISVADDKFIRSLKQKGITIREIARRMNVSVTTVWHSIRRTK